MDIVIANDHPLMRIGIRNALLDSNMNARIIGEVGSAAELLKLLSIKLPDIVLLELELSDRDGLALLHDLKKMYSKLPVLILSGHPAEHIALRALKAGAFGYLNNKAVESELLEAIRTIVRQKKRYVNSEAIDILAKQLAGDLEKLPHQHLSAREYEVLSLIARGNKVSEIADKLFLSVQTIHTYRRRIKLKMKMNSNAELIRYALEHDLVV